jgi:hypothetical protein
MKILASLFLALALLPLSKVQGTATPQASPTAAPLHLSSTFHFVIHAPISCAAPLFGPNGERAWAGGHWDPQFLYPQPAKDIQGAVFTVQHGSLKSLWINTLFDVNTGRMQYVSVIPDAVVSTIDVRLTSVDPATTTVEVTYVRTALDPSANQHVQHLAHDDLDSGPDWQKAIEPAVANCGK